MAGLDRVAGFTAGSGRLPAPGDPGSSTDIDPLVALRGRIDLDRVPFTDRGSRLLVFRQGRDALEIAVATFGTDPHDAPVVRALWFETADAGVLPLLASARPDRLDFDAGGRPGAMVFADRDTLVVATPPGAARVVLEVRQGHLGLDDQVVTVSNDMGYDVSVHPSMGARLMPIEAAGDRDYIPIRVELNADVPASGGMLAIRVAARNVGRRSAPAAAWVVDFERVADSAAGRWRSWFSRSPTVTSVPQAAVLHAWWVLGVNTVELGDGRRGLVPSKSKYVGIWSWDAYFHALALRHVDPGLARGQFRIILGAQLPDGQLPDVVHLDGGTIAHTRDVPGSEGRLAGRAESSSEVAADRVARGAPLTKPPLAAWAIWKIHVSHPDQAFLSEVYEPLRRAHEWWFATSDPDGDGLPEYLHPYSAGIDDSPLFDLGLPVATPDLPAYLAVDCDALANIAEALHLPVDATYWRWEAARLTERLVELRWDRAAGRFRSWTGTTPITTRTAFELMPLLTGRLPKPVARRLVSTLTDTSRFWTTFPVPTVAIDDPLFEPSTMWRGPVWLNVNYMLIEGLFRSGYPAVARRLRERTLALVASQADIREYYDPLTGDAPMLAASCFGWTAALFLDLAINDRPMLGRN